jgi:urea transport system permease protein
MGFLHASIRALVLGACLLAAAPKAQAGDLAPLVPPLGTGSFAEKIEAVGKLAATGEPRAAEILQALVDGRLVTRKEDSRVLVAAPDGASYADAATGDPVTAAAADVDTVTVNNKLRGVVRGALGGLTLLSPDRATRLRAAEAVLKTRNLELLPILEKAAAGEADAGVKRQMEIALGATRLLSSDPAIRLSGVPLLAGTTDADVRSLLDGLLAKNADGSFAEADEKVRSAAAEVLEAGASTLMIQQTAEKVFQGISLGSVLLLSAIGLAITFGVMGIINMAHGEMVMLGAYTTFVVQQAFRAWAPGAFDYSLFVAIPAAFVVAGVFGIVIERLAIRFLYGRPLETLLMTWGLSLILQQTVRSIFGPTNQQVGSPSWMQGAVEVAGISLTYNRIWIIVFAGIVFAGLVLLLRRTALGLEMRAVTQNRGMASAMGIRTGRVDALTFGLGSGIAGIAGVALSQIDNVRPNLGQSYIIDSFMVVVFGGVGNLWGTLVGALTLGVATKFVEPMAGAVAAKILVLVAIILFIQRRPRGLFALRGRAVES